MVTSILRYFWPLTLAPWATLLSSPPLFPVPLISGPPHQMKRWLWGGPELWTRSRVRWPGVNSCLFWFVSYMQTFPHRVWVCGLSQQVLSVLWVMANINVLPYTLFEHMLPKQSVFLEYGSIHCAMFEQLRWAVSSRGREIRYTWRFYNEKGTIWSVNTTSYSLWCRLSLLDVCIP